MKSVYSSDKKNRTILITGASSGIGYQAAVKILKAGHEIIIPCRNEKRSKYLLEQLLDNFNNDFELVNKLYSPVLDLADLNSIKDFTSELLLRYESIDTLVLNAGLQYTGAKQPRWSLQGFELTFAVNHLANQYLFERIESLLYKSISEAFPKALL